MTNGDQRKIVIEGVDSRAMVGVINAGAQKVRDLRWAGPPHLLVTTSQTDVIGDVLSSREESFLAVDYNLLTKSEHPLLIFLTSQTDWNLNVIYGYPETRSIGGRPYAFVQGTHFVGNRGRLTLFKVDLDRGAATIESQGFENTRNYTLGSAGAVIAESESDAPSSRWTLKIWNGHWQDVQSRQTSIDTPDLLGLGRDGLSLLVGAREEDHFVLRELSPDGSHWSDALEDADPQRLIYDPAGHNLFALSKSAGDADTYDFLSPDDKRSWKALVAAYPGTKLSYVSMSDDHKKWVVYVDSPVDGPAYALVDLESKKGRWIGDVYSGLRPSDVAPVRLVSFKAADGFALSGYLTRPRDKAARGLSLIVLPHGGPAARDRPAFDWWAQALASRGYAVLLASFSNFRVFVKRFVCSR